LASFNPDTGVITYTPDSDYVGEDSFSFQVTDNHNARSNIAAVSINVSSNTTTTTSTVATLNNDNRAPVANSQTITTNVNTPKTITLSADDTDLDTLTASVTRPPANGQLSEINQITGEVTYTPANDYTGKDSFQFKVTDDKGADSTRHYFWGNL
jgi:hypothetical protein